MAECASAQADQAAPRWRSSQNIDADTFGLPRSPSVETTRPLAPKGREYSSRCPLESSRHRPSWSRGLSRSGLRQCESFGFFGATDKTLTKSNSGMGGGKISIQLQRMLALGDALRSAVGHYVDKSAQRAERMVRDRGQGFGQLRFGCCKGRHGIDDKGTCAFPRPGPRAPIQ